MKKSALGFVSLLLVLVTWLGFATLKVFSHFHWDRHDMGFGSGLFELVSGSVIMLMPVVLILSIIAYFQDRFVIKSYSFLALMLILGTFAYAFIPR